MDLRKIKALIDLLEKSNLTEIEIKEGEESVRISRTVARPGCPSCWRASTCTRRSSSGSASQGGVDSWRVVTVTA